MLDGISLLDLILHVDKFLDVITVQYGVYVYILIFLVIFCENGIFFPLPGDSLIFAGAAYAVKGQLSLWLLFVICFVAAVIGGILNYYLGVAVGRKIYDRAKGRFISRENIDRATAFYARHGGKAIVFSRFIPIIRQFTPFVAGISKMDFRKFMIWNLVGVTAWVIICAAMGYFFGNIPVVKENFSAVVIGIIVVSLLPALIGFLRTRIKRA
ncbi:membrane-associated protein [Sporobacter termitidis DSM 10068]|uniref:Membrane-associated protein n=1 Tax=Sporobacter termitidis DSM 10068 TaxID=1123282 RepID=A0A1M5YLJ8_9FIRM|nr:VTT domain-containing protein [Sporobacter termitidis]SHI12945.1 membrane-associated protein [Sporobacter termitidis DSM 10068]